MKKFNRFLPLTACLETSTLSAHIIVVNIRWPVSIFCFIELPSQRFKKEKSFLKEMTVRNEYPKRPDRQYYKKE